MKRYRSITIRNNDGKIVAYIEIKDDTVQSICDVDYNSTILIVDEEDSEDVDKNWN